MENKRTQEQIVACAQRGIQNRPGNVCNIERRSRNHCCNGKAVRITYSECAFVALVIQHAMRMGHTAIRVVSGSTILLTKSAHKRQNLKEKLQDIKLVFSFFPRVF